MCSKGILITNGICDSDNECKTENCDFCTRDGSGDETCAICKKGYVITI